MKRLKTTVLGLLLLAAPVMAQDQEPVWIDVRTAEEYAEGHVPGAVNIPHGRVVEGVVELGLKNRDPIYVYCRAGNRSFLAYDVLRRLGYRKVKDLKTLENAMEKWQEQQEETPAEES